ncbi:MAG: TlpA family protein disulfide reductase [Caldisericia bacterium]|nr:TlpA family protein disulfide reductase [Caldisericia bacterium]
MKTKRIISTLLATIMIAALSLSFVACGGESGELPVDGLDSDVKLKVGDEVPDLAFKIHPVSSGDSSSIWKYMEDEKAEALILDFWAVWCEPCKAELPYLEVMYRKYKDKGLRVLGVTIDPEDMNTEGKIMEILEYDPKMNNSWKALGEYEKAEGDIYLSYPIPVDGTREMSKKLGVTSIPRTILITKDHKIYYQHVGFDEGKVKDLEDKVKEYLKIQE